MYRILCNFVTCGIWGCASSTFKSKKIQQPKSFKILQGYIVKMELNFVLHLTFVDQHAHTEYYSN